MAAGTQDDSNRQWNRLRIAAWSTAAFVLLLPLVAMQFTSEVNWTVSDFVFAGAMILITGITYELTVRLTPNAAYRAGVGVALAAAFILVWVTGAVGIIGSEDNPANLMYGGVLTLAIAGAFIAAFRPDGMARTMITTAVAQALIAVIAIVAHLGYPESPPLELLFLNGFFLALWLLSAWLFRKAGQQGPDAAP